MSLNDLIQKIRGTCSKCEFNYELLKTQDLDFFVETRNLARKFLHNSNFFTINDAQIWFNTLVDNQYVLVSKSSSLQKIGYFRLKLIEPANLQVGLDLHPDFQGQGFGFALYGCLIHHWPSLNEIETLSLYVLSSNTRAVSLYLKLGFVIKCIEPIRKDNDLLDNIYMEFKA